MLFNKVIASFSLLVLFSTGVLQAQEVNLPNTSNPVSSPEQTEARRIKYLQGLHKINSGKEKEFADSVTEKRGYTESNILLLSQDYQKIQRYEYTNLMEYSEFKWTADVYVDSSFVIRAKA